MALQTSGAISLANIAAEFGGSAPHSLSEYYGAASGIPSSGAISFSNFYGASNLPTSTCATTYTLWASYGYGTTTTSWITVGTRYTNCTNGSCYRNRVYARARTDFYVSEFDVRRYYSYSRLLKNGSQVSYISATNGQSNYSSYVNITCNNNDQLRHQKRQNRYQTSTTTTRMFSWVYSGVNDSSLLTTS